MYQSKRKQNFVPGRSFIHSETAEVGRNLSTSPQGFQNRVEFSVSNLADNHMLIKFDVLGQFYFFKASRIGFRS